MSVVPKIFSNSSSQAFCLALLSISFLRWLDDENCKFYDIVNCLFKAFLITRFHTQPALKPYIDPNIYRARHVIRVQLINKGIEFIEFCLVHAFLLMS